MAKTIKISTDILNKPGWLGERFSRQLAIIDLRLMEAAGMERPSTRQLADRWKWAMNTVRTFLKSVSIDTPTDTPIDTPIDTANYKKDSALDVPIDTPTDTPTDTPIDTPIDTANYKKDSALDVPIDTPTDTPTDTPIDTLKEKAPLSPVSSLPSLSPAPPYSTNPSIPPIIPQKEDFAPRDKSLCPKGAGEFSDTSLSDGNSAAGAGESPAPTPSPQFRRPTVQEVAEYCRQRCNGIDAGEFIDHYQSNGWMVGRTGMKDWRAAVRTWERKRKELQGGKPDKLQTIIDERNKFQQQLNGIFNDTSEGSTPDCQG